MDVYSVCRVDAIKETDGPQLVQTGLIMENEIKSISMQDLLRVVTDWGHGDDSSSILTSASSDNRNM